MRRLGRKALIQLAHEAGLQTVKTPQPPAYLTRKRRYITRKMRLAWVKASHSLEASGRPAQAAGLRDKAITLERESLRRKLAYRKRERRTNGT